MGKEGILKEGSSNRSSLVNTVTLQFQAVLQSCVEGTALQHQRNRDERKEGSVYRKNSSFIKYFFPYPELSAFPTIANVSRADLTTNNPP